MRQQLFILQSAKPGQKPRFYITSSESGTGKPEWTEFRGDASRMSKVQGYSVVHDIPHNKVAVMQLVPTMY